MLMTYIWLGMAAASVLFGAASGRLDAVSAAVTEGAGAAVTLCLGIAGAMCLWSGVLEAMERESKKAMLDEFGRGTADMMYASRSSR